MLEDYDIGGLLGKGGFAHVYRCRHRITGLEYAVKVIHQSHAMTIQQEISLHSICHHPNIVEFIESFDDENNTYIILESCRLNLFKYVKTVGKLTERLSGYIVKQVFQALEYLHSRNILHRDIKLSNILISKIHSREMDNIDIKLCDFGLAIQNYHPDEEQYTLCGTPNYLAPGTYISFSSSNH